MAIIKWSGAAQDDDPANPTNWQGGVAPLTTDDVVLDDSATFRMRIQANGLTCKSFTMWGGTFGCEGQTLHTTGDCWFLGGSINDLSTFSTGTITVGGNFGLGITAFADATFNIGVTGNAGAFNGVTLANLHFTGTACRAQGCSDGGGNVNVNFSQASTVVPPSPPAPAGPSGCLMIF